MKKLVIFCLATAALASFPACTTEDDGPEPFVHHKTTTTEERTTSQPVSRTTETRTTHSY